MKRIINFRPFLYSLIGIIMGISLFYFLKTKIIFPIIIFAIIIFIYLILSIFKKINYFKFIILFFSIIMGFCLSFVSFSGFLNKNESYSQYYCEIINVEIKENYSKIIVKNIKNKYDNKLLNKNALITVYDATNLCENDYILFNGELETIDLISDNYFNNYYYKFNIGYTINLSYDDITILKNNANIFDNIRLKIKNILFHNNSLDFASISYSVLFGDYSFINQEDYDLFSKTGTVHLLAISGLNTSIFCLVLSFVLDKLKIKKLIKFILILLFLLFYLCLCNFCISAVRATIMSLILCLGNLIYHRYDILSSFSLTLILILLFNPFSLFDSSFLLSSLSVYSIIVLYPIISNLFQKVFKQNNYFIDALAISLSTFLFTFLILANLFNEINFLSIITNIFVIPLFNVYYVSLLLVTFLCLIFPFLNLLLFFPKFILNIVINICKLSYLIKPVSVLDIHINIIICLIILAFVISDYLMVTKNTKLIISIILTINICLTPLFSYIQNLTNNQNIYFIGKTLNCVLIQNKTNTTLINLGDYGDYLQIINFLKRKNIAKINNLIFSEFNKSISNDIINFYNFISIDTIYLFTDDIDFSIIQSSLPTINIIQKDINTNFKIDSLNFKKIVTQNGSGICLNMNNKNIIIFNNNLQNKVEFFKEIKSSYNDIFVVRLKYYPNSFDDLLIQNTNFFVDNTKTQNSYIISLYKYFYVKYNFLSNQFCFVK